MKTENRVYTLQHKNLNSYTLPFLLLGISKKAKVAHLVVRSSVPDTTNPRRGSSDRASVVAAAKLPGAPSNPRSSSPAVVAKATAGAVAKGPPVRTQRWVPPTARENLDPTEVVFRKIRG